MQLAEAGGLGAGAGVSTGVWEVGGLETRSELHGVCPVPGSVLPQEDSGYEASSQSLHCDYYSKRMQSKRRMGKAGRSASSPLPVESQMTHRGPQLFPWWHVGSVVSLGSMLENLGPRVSLAADHVGSLCWHRPEFQAPEGWAGGPHGLHHLHSVGRVSPSYQFTVGTPSKSRLPAKG